MATLAKLTSQSTQTLSLLLERQRLQTLSGSGSGNSTHLTQIARNLKNLRTGIVALEEKEGKTEAVRLLRSQYERMRGMLGVDGERAGVESLADPSPVAGSSSSSASPSPPPPEAHDRANPFASHTHTPSSSSDPSGPFTPYTDDPEAAYPPPDEPSTEDHLLLQRQLISEQDLHLDTLSHSINRQRDLSLQINDELDVHTGLLEGLEEEVDGTERRLGGARRRLERVAKGTRENGSTVMIGLLILVLLILIIVFKT
ncbi:hypothetical protein BXZ70DRAFT_1076009 [Cristinia sonorae]|uniref:t-SNARE coiled-coil homology domain-containing protein n=1 Tax=Cristinia sonorae TaxID=1940300 RepID=A0A8K0XS37_9AGAR|nr:hypothetical protein BXZ70DRAFT_1076009 [Cristinia sonorae]